MMICFIEDHPADLREMSELLKDELHDAEVRTAESVEEGREVLRKARERGESFDVIILDLKLPHVRGEAESFDHDLSKLARSLFPSSAIIVRTAYVDSDSLPLPRIMMRGANLVVNKNSPDAEQELIQAIVEYPILRRLREIFGSEESEAVSRRRERLYEPGGSLTLEINSLIADILRNYDKISDEAKEEINRHVPIRKKAGVYVAEFTTGTPRDEVAKDENA